MNRLPSFRLQYASNLFVDSHTRPFDQLVRPVSGNLALLGNIGRPEHPNTFHFLKYCSKNWNNVFWIPGPHELTNIKDGRASYKEKVSHASSLANQFTNVQSMTSKEAIFRSHNVVLLGTPLWTHLKLPPKGQLEFERIFSSVDEAGPVPITFQERNKWHAADKRYLMERSLFWTIVYPEVNLVYLTHTLPTTRLLRSPISDQAMNRLPLDADQCQSFVDIRAWLGGATGSTHSLHIGSNPAHQFTAAVNSLYEYPYTKHQAQKQDYDPECVLEIQPQQPKGNSPLHLPHLILPPLLASLLERKAILPYA